MLGEEAGEGIRFPTTSVKADAVLLSLIPTCPALSTQKLMNETGRIVTP